MFFNSRIAGLILAAIIAVTLAGYLAFLDILSLETILSTSLVTFFTAFLFIFLTLEFVILQEINKLYKTLDKLKKKDFKQFMKRIKSSGNQFSKINEDLFAFASQKEDEIDELKKLEVYRREFLADISHELKTPIFAAQGFIHTLLDGAIHDKANREKFLRKAAKNLDGLEALVQDIITISQMETGEIKMVMEIFDLKQLIREIFEQLEDNAEKKEIRLLVDASTSGQLFVQADPFRIRQVMINLIDNAIKYGNDKGEVKVVLEKEKEVVHVSVKDDGPGIAPEHIGRIFERFYRIEKSRSKERGGSGLGLSIVQKVIEAHNSKVSVTSKIGKGTIFAFKLKTGSIGKTSTLP